MYQVTWIIDIDADTPREAALRALAIQRDPNSIAQVFEVSEPDSDPWTIDLLDPHDPHEPYFETDVSVVDTGATA